MFSNLQRLDPVAGVDGQATATHGDTGPLAAVNRPLVNTFDVFDTLIARRSVTPLRVFERIARESGTAGFLAARLQAEAMVSHAPYTLDTIYGALGLLLGLTPETAATLKATEIEVEVDEAIPVRETIEAVRDGDLLLSDMYLPPDVIRRMLAKAGLDKAVTLVVTSAGKHSGRIWPEVLGRFAIAEHRGDNPHSDAATPQRFGIPSRLTDVTAPSLVEKILIDVGLHDLAQICRETRLAIGSNTEAIRTLQIIQANLNVPLLILGSVALARHARRSGATSLLFSSRDCNLWLPMFEHVARLEGSPFSSEYFYTSRLTRTQASPDYLAYAGERMGPRSLVVDICGTGWSVSRLAATLGIRQPLFLLHRLTPSVVYEAAAATPDACDVAAIVERQQDHLSHMSLEMCNYAAHGMVEDVRLLYGVPAPVFATDDRSDAVLSLVRAQQACARTATDVLGRSGLQETLRLDDGTLRSLFSALYGCLSQQVALNTLFAQQHLIEDAAIMQRLGGR